MQTQNGAESMGLNNSSDATNMQASAFNIDSNYALDSVCQKDQHVNVKMQPPGTVNGQSSPCVSCSTISSTTVSVSKQTERNMQIGHVTFIDKKETNIFGQQRNSQGPVLENIKHDFKTIDCHSPKFTMSKWENIKTECQSNCSYCNSELKPEECALQCNCPRKYILCTFCSNQEDKTELDFHVCSRMMPDT